ncbi:tetratricopeptide repeat protein [Desulfosoma sp.]|uniref:tetratricopeptide repeat protein n=1 Tax=Desulfosoma sp. TaxID=2603217 RepID=UPI004049C994
MGRMSVLWMCVGLAIFWGCTPKRPVVLPGPWAGSTPTVQAPSTPAPASSTPSAPSASIKEKTLPETPQVPPSGTPAAKPPKEPSPQYLASVQLVHEGDRALAKGDPDGALGFYEQAVQVDAYNGSAFLGLAKVWLQKNAPKRSLEFAKKAEILLTNQPKELRETYLLQSFLYEMLNEPELAKTYKQKAQRLP